MKKQHQKLKRVSNKKVMLFSFLLAISFLLTGCNFSFGVDVEKLMQPPEPSGDNYDIKMALNDFVYNSAESERPAGIDYVLKYPKSGENRSAFVKCDLDNDGVDEAIAFYRFGESGKIRINVLKIEEGKWASFQDAEGATSDIDRVEISDVNGDNCLDVLVGWNTGTKDKQLFVYTLSEDLLSSHDLLAYEEMIIDDFERNGRMSILLFNTHENATSAVLWGAKKNGYNQNDIIAEIGKASLDSTIDYFYKIFKTKTPNGDLGVFLDAYRMNGAMVTELIYFDSLSGELRTPFYSAESHDSKETYRDSIVKAMDIDEDGVLEYPRTDAVFTQETIDSSVVKVYKTEWMSWDFEKKKSKSKAFGATNLKDGYALTYIDDWQKKVVARYDNELGVLIVSEVGSELLKEETERALKKPDLFAIKAVRSVDGKNEVSNVVSDDRYSKYDWQEFRVSRNINYLIWINEEQNTVGTEITKELINNLFIPLNSLGEKIS